MSRSAQLLTLQTLDDRLGHLADEIARLQRDLAEDLELDRLRATHDTAVRDAGDATATAAAVEHELGDLTHKAQQLERHLYSGAVTNPAELQRMEADLNTLRARRDATDQLLLEAMEAAETADAEAAAADAAVSAQRERRAASRPSTERDLAAALAEQEQVQRERTSALAATEYADADLYARVAAHMRPAVVTLSGDSCGGCHLPLGTLEARALRAGSEPIQCSNCDRIIVAT